MLGPRITTVFKSRWRALWWSAGILLTVYCSIPQAEQPKPAPKAEQRHANPWAKDKQ